jgi:hypothetical protein
MSIRTIPLVLAAAAAMALAAPAMAKEIEERPSAARTAARR